ncbi:MAG: YfiR family protein [bacterium]
MPARRARAAEAAAERLPEYSLKAAFLFQFARFVTWPASALSSERLRIGILGEDPFGGELDSLIVAAKFSGRGAAVVRFAAFGDIDSCDVLFIPKSQDAVVAGALQALAGRPTLTVGESDQFANSGGMIRFKPDGSKMSFSINRDAATAAGLEVSARLLEVAKR